ncbi:MAG: preprotein translocase subunit SecG [Thermodesulfobacteriota bacterium]
MTNIVLIFHVVVCFALIFIVLLQHGKGAGIGAAFGGSSQTVFGSTGAAPFLAKLTAIAAILFMVTSLSLAFLSRQKAPSVMRGVEGKGATQKSAPAGGQTPAAPTKSASPSPSPQAPASGK